MYKHRDSTFVVAMYACYFVCSSQLDKYSTIELAIRATNHFFLVSLYGCQWLSICSRIMFVFILSNGDVMWFLWELHTRM